MQSSSTKTTTWIFLIFLFFFYSLSVNAQQLDVRYSQQPEPVEEGEYTNFIDNQAYLRELEARRRARATSVQQNAPIIIINNYNNGYYRDRRCESRGVTVHSDNYSFSYQDGYRPNCYQPILIMPKPHPPRPTPYIHKKYSPHRRGTHR